MAKQWTNKEDDILREMRTSGASFRACARELPRRTTGACQQRAFHKGLSKTRLRESPKKQTELPVYIDEDTQVPTGYVFTNQRPKPAWWSAMMWWRK